MRFVAALYRYPVKGFTPEVCRSLTVLDQGRIAGDRVLGVRFADTKSSDDAWSKKTGMPALMNTPGLTRLQIKFDQQAFRLCIESEATVLVDEILDAQGKERIASAIGDYVLNLPGNPLSTKLSRMPLKIVGDGIRPRYHDSEAGRITLHGRGSLNAVAGAFPHADMNEVRFRSNIAVDGLEPWEEQMWIGRKVRIGAIDFNVIKATIRCLAIHANPQTGERGLPILTTLTRVLGQKKPVFGISMLPCNGGGTIQIGDSVRLVD